MAYTWGGEAFPVNPDLEGGIEIVSQFLGSAMRTANGTLRIDTIAEKDRITLRFSNLTLTELNGANGMRALYNSKASTSNALVLEEAARTWTVLGSHNGFQELATVDGGASGRHYGCVIVLDEVEPCRS